MSGQMQKQPSPEENWAPDRPIVLIGMMGAGKSVIGKFVAARLGLPFVDADHEIEAAAGMTIAEIFEQHGEAHFRDGERRVIERLLREGPSVLATGGGAYMDEETRANIAELGISVWLRATFDVLWERVSRRSHRPLLQTADPQGTLKRLMDERYPVYEKADIIVDSKQISKEAMRDRVISALRAHEEKRPNA